jgi:hypothetical protein
MRKMLLGMFFAVLFSSMITSSCIVQLAISKPGAYLTFTITKAGKIWFEGDPITDEVMPGILTLYDGATKIRSWKAGSGDNDPAHQNHKYDPSGPQPTPYGGPIPSGTWNVRKLGDNPAHPNWYPIDKVSYTGPRDGFYIHGWGVTHGCIAIESGKYEDFKKTIKPYFSTIPLYVSYCVGGVVVPFDKFGLLAPYFGLASTIIIAAVATSIYVKHVKRRKEMQ